MKPRAAQRGRYLENERRKKIMTSKSEKTKFLMAIGLAYIVCLLIVWDSADRAKSIKALFATSSIALVLNALLYLIREKYESSKKLRLIIAVGLLVSYVIYGVTFRNLISQVYFVMTMAVFVFIASFIVNLQQSDI